MTHYLLQLLGWIVFIVAILLFAGFIIYAKVDMCMDAGITYKQCMYLVVWY